MYRVTEPVTPEDFQKIFDLRFEILRAPWNQPRGSERDDNEQQAIHAMICEVSGDCIAAGRLQFNNTSECQIRYMAVSELYRGQGLGRKILEYLEERAKQKSASVIVLQARENALNFYEQSGYINEGKSFVLFNAIQHYRMRKML